MSKIGPKPTTSRWFAQGAGVWCGVFEDLSPASPNKTLHFTDSNGSLELASFWGVPLASGGMGLGI